MMVRARTCDTVSRNAEARDNRDSTCAGDQPRTCCHPISPAASTTEGCRSWDGSDEREAKVSHNMMSAHSSKEVRTVHDSHGRRARVPDLCPPLFRMQYTVRPGDTMRRLAREYEISVQRLAAVNHHISDPDVLYPGDVLCVPEPPPPSPPDVPPRVPRECPPGFRGRFSVRPGDTMWRIGRQFSVRLTDLIRANPHVYDPDRIAPGDVLCVPTPDDPPLAR